MEPDNVTIVTDRTTTLKASVNMLFYVLLPLKLLLAHRLPLSETLTLNKVDRGNL